MIKVEGIPKFEGNLDTVLTAATNLVTTGNNIVSIAQDLESKFRSGMDAHYVDGPEKHLLLDAMLPVKNEGELFGPELSKVAGALRTFVSEVRDNVNKLNGVKGRAEAWKRKVGNTPEDEIDDNEDWVKEENQLHKDISDSMQAISEAEMRCANKIATLYGGRKWDEKSGHRDGDPEPPPADEDKEPPWGKPLEYDAPWYEDALDFAGGVLKGIFVDGILGTLDALTTLIPIQPLLNSMGVKSIFGHELPDWNKCGEAWKGVGLTLASAAMYAVPGAAAFMHLAFPGTAAYLDNVGLTVLKGMVAWDMWGEDPGRALGQVGFNVITTVGTGGAGGAVRATAMAGKYGAVAAKVAKGAELAVNVTGKFVRPGQAAFDLAMKLPKVSDLAIKVGSNPVIGGLAKFGGLDIPKVGRGVDLPSAHVGVDAPHVPDHTPVSVGGGDSPSYHGDSSPSTSSAGHSDAPPAPSHTDTGGGDHTPSSPGDSTPASHSDTPPAHSDTPPAHSDAPAAHSDSPAPHSDAPASPSDGPAAHSDAPAAHSDAPAAHSDAPATHSDAPASHTDSPAPHSDSTPSHADSQTTPGTHTPDQPTTHTPDQPTTHTPDQPTTHTPDQPTTHTPDQPTTHTPDQPTTHTPDQPTTHTPDQPTTHHDPSGHQPGHVESRLHPDGPPAPHDPNRIGDRLNPDGPGRPHEPSNIDSRLHPDGPPAPHDPNRIGDRLNPDSPNAPHQPDAMTHAPDAPTTPHGADTPPMAPPIMPGMHTPGTHTPGGHTPGRPHADAPDRPRGDRTPDEPHTGAGEPHGTHPQQPNAPHPNQPNAPHPQQPNAPHPNQLPAPHQPPHVQGHPGQDRHMVEPNRYHTGDRDGSLASRHERSVGDPPIKNVKKWLKSVNPFFKTKHPAFRNNCGDSSRTFADTLQGREPRLANGDFKIPPGERMEMYENTGIRPEAIKVPGVHDPNLNPREYTDGAFKQIEDSLKGKPPGTVAIVGGSWHKGLLPDGTRPPGGGHWFNAFVDQKGRVRWADAQSGKTGPWPPKYGDDGKAMFNELEVMTREPGGHWTSPVAPGHPVGIQPTAPSHLPPAPPAPNHPFGPQPHAPNQPGPYNPPAPQHPVPNNPYQPGPHNPTPQQPVPNNPYQPGPHNPTPQQPVPNNPYQPGPHNPTPQQPVPNNPYQPQHAPQQTPHQPTQPAPHQPQPTQPTPQQPPAPHQPATPTQPHPHQDGHVPAPGEVGQRLNPQHTPEAGPVHPHQDGHVPGPGEVGQRLNPEQHVPGTPEARAPHADPAHPQADPAHPHADPAHPESDPAHPLADPAHPKADPAHPQSHQPADGVPAAHDRAPDPSTRRDVPPPKDAQPINPTHDPNHIESRLNPDGPPAPHDPNRIENALHPDGPPAPRAPHDPNRIENALHPDGPPAPHDPNRIGERLNPERPVDPREDYRVEQPGQRAVDPRENYRVEQRSEGAPERPVDPREDYRVEQPGQRESGQPPQAFGSGEADWTPGDPDFGVSKKEGFDPGFHHKPLGDEFAPGVHDPDNAFQDKERVIAEKFAEEKGWRLDGRLEDHGVQDLKNPECMVRKEPGDPGRITEFKTLDPPKAGSNPVNAVKRNINDASHQVPPDGEIVIDTRNIPGLTEEDVLRAYKKALGQPKGSVAKEVHIILGDGRVVTYVKEG